MVFTLCQFSNKRLVSGSDQVVIEKYEHFPESPWQIPTPPVSIFPVQICRLEIGDPSRAKTQSVLEYSPIPHLSFGMIGEATLCMIDGNPSMRSFASFPHPARWQSDPGP